jgi:hypothetical protein
MKSAQNKERSIALGVGIAAAVTAGSLATGGCAYHYGKREGLISPPGWRSDRLVEVVSSECDTLTWYDACADGSTRSVIYRQCDGNNFVDDKDGPVLKTPNHCIDWKIKQPSSPDASPVLAPGSPGYPNPILFLGFLGVQ